VLAHQFGHDLVLLLNLGFQGFDLSRLGRWPTGPDGVGFQSQGAIVEELFLPEVKEGWLDLMLLANIGDGPFLDQVFAKDSQLLDGGKMTTFCSHRV
jgi:hypothetical protein